MDHNSPSRHPRPKGPALFLWYAGLYLILAGQYIKARMSYRADFIVSSFGMVISIFPGLLGTVVVFRSIPNLVGWTLPELVFLYAFSLLALCLVQIVFDNLWQLRGHLQTGTFIKYYFKPINMLFYYTSDMVDLKGFTQLAMAIGFLVWSSIELNLVWTLAMIGGFLVLLAGASLIMTGLLLAAASTAFWIVNSFSILNLFSRFRDYAKYPLTIYSAPFRLLFSTLVPIGFIAYYPATWLLRPGTSGLEVWLTIPAGLACLGLGILVWTRGVRSWSGTGT